MIRLALGLLLALSAFAQAPAAQSSKDANAPQADGTTPLHWAVREGNSARVTELLKAGAKPGVANRYGITPLYLACESGNAKIAEQLLAAGADANAISTEGETALMTAAHAGSVEVTRVLLKHGAKVDAREDWHGETALMWAVAQHHADVAKELIAAGADVNARSSVDKWERQTTQEPREKWLPPGGFTPVLFAARQGCVECVDLLASKGANLNAADPDGISPLVSSLINGHFDVAALLIEKGADLSLADKTGRTAIYAAVDANTMPASNRPPPIVLEEKHSAMDVVNMLIAKGANVNAVLKSQIPYRTKLDRGDDGMLTAGTTPLIRAAKAGDVDAMKSLLGHGADAKLATRNGVNALMAAAGLGTKDEDTTGRLKTEEQAIEAIDLCLKAGVDVNALDSQGRTAIHGAALRGLDKVVQALADRGAKLGIKDRKGLTPLDLALGKGGGAGFDGNAADVHATTAELLTKLAKK